MFTAVKGAARFSLVEGEFTMSLDDLRAQYESMSYDELLNVKENAVLSSKVYDVINEVLEHKKPGSTKEASLKNETNAASTPKASSDSEEHQARLGGKNTRGGTLNKVMKNVFLGISAIVSIIVVSKMVGHPPRGIIDTVLYAMPGGILMHFIFQPLLNVIGHRANDKENVE